MFLLCCACNQKTVPPNEHETDSIEMKYWWGITFIPEVNLSLGTRGSEDDQSVNALNQFVAAQ